ncbi:hypothetical protein BS47DRAFT_1371669 [Hydnum rufescens UP504]|uniref:choline-phosphate cytidylyltransferase n=1 Tax=Hydnum rufescens UP504 TaxID=1448309 RepID=A0A9P6B3I7_9AGAM|nr:hypothetical protein BS47DRAFT_1371669 [Hydnum rufescens UP504]
MRDFQSTPPCTMRELAIALSVFQHANQSEEDNTDDGSSIGVTPWARNQPTGGPTSLIQGRLNSNAIASSKSKTGTSRLAHVADADSGVDSPTYDGDVETTSTTKYAAPHPYPTSPVGRVGATGGGIPMSSILLAPSAPIATIPNSPSSSSFADPPSSSVSTESFDLSIEPPPLNPPPLRHVSGQPSHATSESGTNLAATESKFHTSGLSPEDIRRFIQRAIEGLDPRPYSINPPPSGRPVRIYADGVYDMFHFGHALQLRQAKLSFPSVHLLVGICSDELCQELKSRTLLSHFERLESARHCRWVDQVVPEAPWVLDMEFLEKYEIDYVAHDEEPYAGAGGADDIYKHIKDLGKFLPTRRTPGISTSELLERLVMRYRLGDFDDKLEKIGHGELSARGSPYDDSQRSPRSTTSPS